MFLFILVITNICVLHFSYHSYMFWCLGRRSGTTKLYSEWWRTSCHPCLCKRSSLTTRWPCGKQLTPSSLRSQFVGALSTGVRQCGGKFKTLACRLHIWSGRRPTPFARRSWPSHIFLLTSFQDCLTTSRKQQQQMVWFNFASTSPTPGSETQPYGTLGSGVCSIR